ARWSDLLNTVRDFARKTGLPAYSVKTQSGFWRFLVLRRSQYSGHWMVQIITTDDAPDILNNLKSQLILNFPEITSLIHGVSRKPSQIAVSDYERVLFGSEFITEHIGSLEFEISSNAFFQTNTQAAEVLYGKALELADFRKTDTVLDLYCGTGTISLFVAPHVKEVVGYELVENAVQNARKNAIHNNISNCSFISGDLRQVLKNTKTFGDVVILDPPRAGLHEEVVQTVLDLDPRTILYISCNPSTQARDVALFCNGPYRLTSIQPVDMFPHTYHIENIVRLERTYGL
ncbi:MAG: 23S rRNA (uracil(1939)-C(5))-methyltransferase RlmD, partial [Bacteroidetes bacterium]|nr:23S rRNA (uracil(1939)-C(5))-methyltransferase RlmD [Bacteroidota bacterium]